MKPWYNGFTGTINEHTDSGKFLTKGTFSILNNHSFSITELPIGKWTSDYKEFLDGLLDSGSIKMYENNSTDTIVSFTVFLNNTQNAHEMDIEKTFKLT